MFLLTCLLTYMWNPNACIKEGCVTVLKQTVGGRPPQYAPDPLLPLWAPKRLSLPSRPRLQSADRNVAVGSHGQHVPTVTAAAV